tara:strand:+ start:2604 stop:2726 length:123 start_codon:yes stop_codon:yes gene_type:complete
MGKPAPGYTGAPPVEHIDRMEVSEGTETSQYLEEKRLFPE